MPPTRFEQNRRIENDRLDIGTRLSQSDLAG